MLTSMTGFGRAEAALASSGRVTIEVRSVNHRFLEVETRLPEALQAFEEAVRAQVTRQVRRGQVRVSIGLRWAPDQMPVVFQNALAQRYLRQLRRLQRQLKLSGPIALETLLTLPQVIAASERPRASTPPWPPIERAVRSAVAEMVRMRKREGARLQKELLRLVQWLGRETEAIRRRVPGFEESARQRLADRIETALKSAAVSLSENRQAILAEAAALVQASDISEELARIDSHRKALRKVISGSAPPMPAAGRSSSEAVSSPGRTLDFLAQEMNREINTLGTKLRDPTVLRSVISMKGQVEKLREQAANIE